MSSKKDTQDFVREIKRLGYITKDLPGGHLGVIDPDKDQVVYSMPKTPSDTRSMKNSVAQFKRAGLYKEVGKVKNRRQRKTVPKGHVRISADFRHRVQRVLHDMGYQPGQRGPGNSAIALLVREGIQAANGGWKPTSESSAADAVRRVFKGDAEFLATEMMSFINSALNAVDRGGTIPPKVDTSLLKKGKVKATKTLVQKWRCIVCGEEFDTVESMMEHRESTHEATPEAKEILAAIPEDPMPDKVWLEVLDKARAREIPGPDELWLRVYGAILDPTVTREEAWQIAVEVRDLAS